MQTWFFALKTEPLTADQIEALDGTPGAAVSLSPYGDGVVMAAVESDTITGAFSAARSKIEDVTGNRLARIVALHGSLADTMFQAANRLHGEAGTPLLCHLHDLWHHEAWDMAERGAREEKCYDRNRNPVPSVIVKPIEHEILEDVIVEHWTRIWHAAKAYLSGTEDEWLAWADARRRRSP